MIECLEKLEKSDGVGERVNSNMKGLGFFAQRARERREEEGGDEDEEEKEERGGVTGIQEATRVTPILLRVTPSADDPLHSSKPSERVEFERFLASNRFLTSSNGAFWNAARKCPCPSHNDLFGGMYLINDKDPETESHFHNLLVLALRQGGVYGLCENRTAFSAMYFDLDFKGPSSTTPSPDDLVAIVGMIRDVFLKVGGPSWGRVSSAIIATSPKQTSPETGMEKFGAHIIFPYIILSMDNMVRLNLACRDMVTSCWPEMRTPPSNSWTDVFDTSMYRTGLRMLFVDKNQKCPHCPKAAAGSSSSSSRNVSPLSPTHVCTNGFVGQNRPYRIIKYIPAESDANDDAMLRRLSQDPVFALHMASIRKPGVRREMPSSPAFDESMPTAAEASMETRRHRREETATTHSAQPTTEMDTRSEIISSAQLPKSTSAILSSAFSGVPFAGQRVFLDSSDKRISILQGLIRDYEPSRFGELVVRGATTNMSKSAYTVHVWGPGRHSCLNCPPSTPHSRSIVYFVVDAKHGVVQKCTSRSDKTETRVSKKTCRAFRAPYRVVPLGPFKDLFSNLKMVSSMNLVIDNGSVYIPKMMLVQPEEVEREEREVDEEGEGQKGSASSRTSKLTIRQAMTDPTLSPNKSNLSSSCWEISGATALFPLENNNNQQPPHRQTSSARSSKKFCSSSSAAAQALIPSTWKMVGSGTGAAGSTRKRTSTNELVSPDHHHRSRQRGTSGEGKGVK